MKTMGHPDLYAFRYPSNVNPGLAAGIWIG
jgi:hypothetical protein